MWRSASFGAETSSNSRPSTHARESSSSLSIKTDRNPLPLYGGTTASSVTCLMGLGVPGLIVRSVHTDASGMPVTAMGSFLTDHRSPLKDRWGGWYVTGTHGSQTHMGNANPNRPDFSGDNVTDLKRYIDTDEYLSPHSDIVALMVLEHQSRMQNLITRVTITKARLAIESAGGLEQDESLDETSPAEEMSESNRRRINNAAEALISYMLFTDEASLTDAVKGTSRFAVEFSKQGPRDRRGRSLRQLELTRRMFQYPCSYMIYSEAFDKLPNQVRERVYRRLWEVLSGQEHSREFEKLSSADREAILEILLDTKTGLPDYWKRPLSNMATSSRRSPDCQCRARERDGGTRSADPGISL